MGKGNAAGCECSGGARLGDAPRVDESELSDEGRSVVDGESPLGRTRPAAAS